MFYSRIDPTPIASDTLRLKKNIIRNIVPLGNPVMLATIQSIAQQLTPRLIEIRRHLHMHPELSGQEHQTSAYVAGVLSSLGLQMKEGIGGTGIMADLKGAGNRILGIRTDMDALPITEQTGLEFASQQPGVMHACGHDLHTTLGLGTAMVLSQLELPGSVRFIFQPAEEIAQGASWMVAADVMAGVERILGVHVFPSIPGGSIGIRYGALTAAADDLEITIQGESGHGARPHEAIDAIWIAAKVITNLQQAIGRTQNPLRPVVLSIGKIAGGRAHNIIADQVTMQGTVRSLHPETHADLPNWVTNIVQQTCQTYGATAQVDYRRGVPSVQNDPYLTQIVEAAAREALGSDQVEILPEPSLGAEDFSMYLEKAPGSMFRLGVGFVVSQNENRKNYPLHHPRFTVNEEAIFTGVVTMAYSAYRYLQHG
jgi:amidohydrolase